MSRPNRYRQAVREICGVIGRRETPSSLLLARWREMIEADEETCQAAQRAIDGMLREFQRQRDQAEFGPLVEENLVGIAYYLAHKQTKTYINLGKVLSSEPRFEGFGHEPAWFLATRPYGTFQMHNDHGYHPLYEENWTEVKAPPSTATEPNLGDH